VLLIAPEQLAQLRTTEDWIPATDMGVQALMSGVVGMIWGCQVVVSNKISTTPTYTKTEDQTLKDKTYYTVADGVYTVVDDPDVEDINTYYEVTQLSYANFIVKPGALAIYMKRDTLLETDRDIINKSTVMTVDKHYVAYLYDASKAIKITTKEI
jgi:N4-gp56 family major capsid protein